MADPTERQRLSRRAILLEYGTIAWNVGEAVLTIALGSLAGSLALIGFGTVSIVEVFASGVVVWHERGADADEFGHRSRRAERLIAGAFLIIGIALLVAAANDLVNRRIPGESIWGIAYLAVTAVVMFGLAVGKRRLADQLESAPLRSEAMVTFLDGILSVTTLAGLALNAFVGWWWADALAAVLVAVAAINEAREAWEESSG